MAEHSEFADHTSASQPMESGYMHARATSSTPEENEIEETRAELIRLSNAGEIKQSESYLKKASGKVVLKLKREHTLAQREKANTLLAETLVTKFTDLMESIGAVNSSTALREELNQDGLFRSDVKGMVSAISPYIPYLGIFSGGVTTAKHVYQRTPVPVADDRADHSATHATDDMNGGW